MDPFYLRRDFKVRLALMGVGNAASSIEVYPSAWLDAPPGRPLPDGWHVADTYKRTLMVIVPVGIVDASPHRCGTPQHTAVVVRTRPGTSESL